MTDYNVLLDLGHTDPEAFDLDPFAPYSGVLGVTPARTYELIITIPATDIGQAITTALALFRSTLQTEPHAVRALSTAAFDAGADLPPSPESLSVSEAAERLGVTPSAVRQRLAAERFPGVLVGRDWQVAEEAVRVHIDDARIRWQRQPDGTFAGDSPRGRYTVVRTTGGWITHRPVTPSAARHQIDAEAAAAIGATRERRRKPLP